MPKIDECELEVLNAFEKGQLKSVTTKAELAKFKAAARATAIKDRRVNIRLSSGDLNDIQVKALEEGVPYQSSLPAFCISMLLAVLRSKVPSRAQLASPQRRGALHQTVKFIAMAQTPKPSLQKMLSLSMVCP